MKSYILAFTDAATKVETKYAFMPLNEGEVVISEIRTGWRGAFTSTVSAEKARHTYLSLRLAGYKTVAE